MNTDKCNGSDQMYQQFVLKSSERIKIHKRKTQGNEKEKERERNGAKERQ